MQKFKPKNKNLFLIKRKIAGTSPAIPDIQLDIVPGHLDLTKSKDIQGKASHIRYCITAFY
jgi:hypothetical protein